MNTDRDMAPRSFGKPAFQPELDSLSPATNIQVTKSGYKGILSEDILIYKLFICNISGS